MKIFIQTTVTAFLSLTLLSCGSDSSTGIPVDETAVTFTSISPSSGPVEGGTSVTIRGTNFESTTTVTFGAAACSNINIISSTELTCITPANSTGSVSITLTNDDETSATEANAFIYGSVAPSFSSISPNSFINTQSTTVTINGAGFVTGMTVTIGGANCSSVSINSGSELVCTSPLGVGAGAQNVVVTNPGAASATGSSAFTFRTPPTLTILRGSSAQGAFQTCQSCHGGNGGLTISNFASLSARVTPGDPGASLIWTRMELDPSDSLSMPRNQAQRPFSERQALADWILDGAQDN